MFTLIFESCPHRESKSKTRCYMHISIATKKMFPFIKDVETFDMHTELSMYILNLIKVKLDISILHEPTNNFKYLLMENKVLE